MLIVGLTFCHISATGYVKTSREKVCVCALTPIYYLSVRGLGDLQVA